MLSHPHRPKDALWKVLVVKQEVMASDQAVYSLVQIFAVPVRTETPDCFSKARYLICDRVREEDFDKVWADLAPAASFLKLACPRV